MTHTARICGLPKIDFFAIFRFSKAASPLKGGRGDQIAKFSQKNEFWIRADLDSASPFLSYLKIFPPKTISK